MFNNFDEFSNWLEISKNFNSQTIKDIYAFIAKFPMADFEDYIKVSKKLSEGSSIEEVIARYQKHIQSIGEKEDDDFIEVAKMTDCLEEMILIMNKGLLKGETTHISIVDECWKWRKGEVSALTGNNNDGKSLLMRTFCLIKGIASSWKTACYAPEDYPASSFFDELIHTASGYSTDKENPEFISEELYRKVYDQIKEYFTFINIRPPKNTLENVLSSFIPLIEKDGVNICIIDPILKVARPKEYLNNDAQWASYLTGVCTDFARKYQICLVLVIHQTTPKIVEGTGVYAKPDKYSIRNGGSISDGLDNVLFLQRPDAPKDLISTTVRFGSLKIKKQKLVGIPQDIMFKFNRRTNRYIDELYEKDLFDFDKHLDIPRLKFKFLGKKHNPQMNLI